MSEKLYVGYFREQRSFYVHEDFVKILGFEGENSLEKAREICEKLVLANVIKKCSRKEFNLNFLNDEELAQQEDEVEDTAENKKRGFYFKFVGVAYVDDCIIKCYPKYLDLPSDDNSSEKQDLDFCDLPESSEIRDTIENHFSLTLKVIRKLSKINQLTSLKLIQSDSSYDKIAAQFSLLEDYYKNGLYSNLETVIETNGEGDIDWDKTINETTAIIKNNKPYYVELKTINTRTSEFDYFKQLHMAVLTECSKYLKQSDLLKYAGMRPVELTTMKVSQFGNTGYIKQRLEQELRVQFVTKKRNQLLYLLHYITHSKSYKYSNDVSLYGTNSFQVIWEKVCKSVFDDLYKNSYRLQNSELGKTPKIKALIPSLIKESSVELEKYKNKTFENIMGNASWELRKDYNSNLYDNKAIKYGLPRIPSAGLTPDLITIHNNYFYILDAKYYMPEAEDNKTTISRQPGVQDVVKQYVYERAFSDFTKAAKFSGTGNAFLMPKRMSKWTEPINLQTGYSDKILMTYEGDVCFDLLQKFYGKDETNENSVKIFELYPEYVYKAFLQSKSCIKEFGEAFEDYIKVEKSWGTELSDNYQKTLIGYIRPEYYEAVKTKTGFIFYFHAEKGNYTYDVHPDLLRCNKIKLFKIEQVECLCTFDGKIISGTLEQDLHLVPKEKLKVLLRDSTGQEIQLSEDVKNYYYMKISDVKIIDINDEEISDLENKIKNYNGNTYLDAFAPKVISR